MPTPPPWCSETQVAPPAVFSSAFSIGQSETASEPSFIDSVSRFGDATEPLSRWSRPITIGAFSSPRFTISLKARPARVALAEADPADARRQALERDPLGRPCRASGAGGGRPGNSSFSFASVFAMSSGSPLSATQRNGPLPRQNSGRM